jgi:hypothetical protein
MDRLPSRDDPNDVRVDIIEIPVRSNEFTIVAHLEARI